MTLCKLNLQEMRWTENTVDNDDRRYHESRCRKAALSLIDAVVSFQPDDWHAFWLPYCSHFFSSAATLMLSCTVEIDNDETAQDCIVNANELITSLRHAKNEAAWDLADTCLAQCERVVHRILHPALMPMPHRRRRNIARDKLNRAGSQLSELVHGKRGTVGSGLAEDGRILENSVSVAMTDSYHILDSEVMEQSLRAVRNRLNDCRTDGLLGGDFYGSCEVDIRDTHMIGEQRRSNINSWTQPLDMLFLNLSDDIDSYSSLNF